MFNIDLFYKLLRWTAQAAVIYLLLRYCKFGNMSSNQALISTLIIMIVCIMLERMFSIYYKQQSPNLFEKFKSDLRTDSSATCKSCTNNVEHFSGSNKKCKIVCDDGDSTNKKNNDVTETFNNGKSTEPTETTKGDGQIQESNPSNEATDANEPNDQNQDIEGEIEMLEEMEQVSEPKQPPPSPPANDDRYYWGTRHGNLGYDNRYGFGGMFYDEDPAYNRFRNSDLNEIRNIGDAYGTYNPPNKVDEANEMIREANAEARARSTSGYGGKYQTVGNKSEKLKTLDNRRRIEGELDDELPYSDYNHLPVAAGYKSHDYEYGYSFLPPEKWYPQPPRPPICVTEKRCPVCPVYTAGAPVDVKEFHSSTRISPPDLINTDYIGEKLNAGR